MDRGKCACVLFYWRCLKKARERRKMSLCGGCTHAKARNTMENEEAKVIFEGQEGQKPVFLEMKDDVL